MNYMLCCYTTIYHIVVYCSIVYDAVLQLFRGPRWGGHLRPRRQQLRATGHLRARRLRQHVRRSLSSSSSSSLLLLLSRLVLVLACSWLSWVLYCATICTYGGMSPSTPLATSCSPELEHNITYNYTRANTHTATQSRHIHSITSNSNTNTARRSSGAFKVRPRSFCRGTWIIDHGFP